MPPEIRLQKFMAECGVASRRQAEKLILSGKVKVNGQTVTKLGTKINPKKDRVQVEGERLRQKEKKIYLKLYKPAGYVSSCRSYGEKTIMDLVKNIPQRLYPVGRLDKDSEGLMILTNDGEFAHRMMHPRYEHEKEYEVTVQSPMSNVEIRKLEEGIILDGKKTLPLNIRRLNARIIRITLREGKKRQIRKMLEAVGNRVARLKRIRIGDIRLAGLRPGEFKYLSL